MTQDINRIQARLQTLGLEPILIQLSSKGGLQNQTELPFTSMETAKMVQRLLYQWLNYHPQAKEKVTLSIKPGIPILTLIPKTLPERRGRKRGGI